MTTTVKDALIAARALIVERGGIAQNGHFRDHDTGHLCMLGALRAALGGAEGEETVFYPPFDTMSVFIGTRYALCDVIDKRAGFGWGAGVVTFNDSPATTLEDVLEVFNAAIAAEK